MENSDNIRGPISSPEIRQFAMGFGDGPFQSPSHVAWMLESEALRSGWQPDDELGSEANLFERIPASRDVIRGAIRIVEARGSMRMRRGCQGGLHLEVPSVDSAAAALAVYLRSHNCTFRDLETVSVVTRPLLPRSPAGEAINAVIAQTLAFLSDTAPVNRGSGHRAELFAMRILTQVQAPLSEDGVRLGTEAELCSEFGLAHRTFRQALNILEDLEILHVRRGRGGGYFLKPANPMGVVRRIFVLLASRRITTADANETLWKLGIARLHMIFNPHRPFAREGREQWADAVVEALRDMSEPRRWVNLQHAIDDLIDDRVTKTLTSAMVAYIARTVAPPSHHQAIESQLGEAEQGVIAAIRQGCLAAAERHLMAGQGLLAALEERNNSGSHTRTQ